VAASDTAAESAHYPPVPIGDLVEPSLSEIEPEIVLTVPRSPMMVVRGVLAALLGAALIVVGTMVMTDVTAVPRVLCVIVGLACLQYTLGSIGKYFGGPTFDPGYRVAVGWMVVLVLLAVFADLLPLAPYNNVQAGMLE